MKRTSKMFAALFLTSALAAGPALAAGGAMMNSGNQAGGTNGADVSRGTNKSPNAENGNMATGQTSNSSMANGNMGAMSDEQMGQLKTADVQSLKVVRQSEAANTDKSTANQPPMDTTAAEQQKIQAALESNPKIVQELKNQAIDVSQVVAANYDGNGTLTVYVR